ncbi:MAG: hypothetical protein WB755_02490, partial [Terriglobales bacterium]
ELTSERNKKLRQWSVQPSFATARVSLTPAVPGGNVWALALEAHGGVHGYSAATDPEISGLLWKGVSKT